MKNFPILICLSLILVALSGGSALGQTPPTPLLLDREARTADARLTMPLTFDADRMYLGELLEKVSAQTGVSVSIPATDPCSGIPITCHIKKMPLADFMNALWSLVSFSNATWQITSDASNPPLRYRLLPTAASRTLPERLKPEVDAYSDRLLATSLKLQTMSPQERETHLHELAEAMLLDKDDYARTYVEAPAANEFWWRVGLVATELSSDQRNQLKQGVKVSVPLSSLKVENQQILLAQARQGHYTRNGVPYENLPDKVQFTFTRGALDSSSLVRDLCIGVGNAHSMVTRNYMGSLSRGVTAQLSRDWLLPGDQPSREVEKQAVTDLPALPQESIWQHVHSFDLLLTQIAEAQHFAYIGVVPEYADQRGVSDHEPRCLEDLRSLVNMVFKWREGTLLFNYPLWFSGDDAPYSYALVKQLRENQQRKGDREPLSPDLEDAVLNLTEPQEQRLAKEFPQVKKINRPLFVFYKRYPAILFENGMAVGPDMIALLKRLQIMPPVGANDSLTRIRMREKDAVPLKAGGRLYSIEFQTERLQPWQLMGDLTLLPEESPQN